MKNTGSAGLPENLKGEKMKKKIIKTGGNPPGPKGMLRPFSAAVRAGDFIFVSGYHGGGINKETGETCETIEAQTRQCLEKVKRTLEAGGAAMADVVKVTVFIHSGDAFENMNRVYAEYFPSEPPARSCVVTQFIRPGMLIQIDCTTYCPVKGE